MPEGAVQITAIEGKAVLRLKSWLPEQTGGGTPVRLAGRELPSQVGGMLHGPIRVLCTGRGDWLIVSRDSTHSSLDAHIAPDLSQQGLVLVDLTAGWTALEVSGPAAQELLSQGCGLDGHPGSFPAGRCARTRFAQIPVVIAGLEAPTRFELHVARSYFHYLRSWLTDAAAEFGDPLT